MIRDKFPMFFMREDKIVEVAYAEWESKDGQDWAFTGMVSVTIPDDIDRVIIETAVGCFQSNIRASSGEEVGFVPSQERGYLPPCDRTREFQKRMRQGEQFQLGLAMDESLVGNR